MDFTEDEIERFLNETGPMSVAKAKYLIGFGEMSRLEHRIHFQIGWDF